jgi:hypothetical protein
MQQRQPAARHNSIRQVSIMTVKEEQSTVCMFERACYAVTKSSNATQSLNELMSTGLWANLSGFDSQLFFHVTMLQESNVIDDISQNQSQCANKYKRALAFVSFIEISAYLDQGIIHFAQCVRSHGSRSSGSGRS